jgi:hypothetical protein
LIAIAKSSNLLSFIKKIAIIADIFLNLKTKDETNITEYKFGIMDLMMTKTAPANYLTNK